MRRSLAVSARRFTFSGALSFVPIRFTSSSRTLVKAAFAIGLPFDTHVRASCRSAEPLPTSALAKTPLASNGLASSMMPVFPVEERVGREHEHTVVGRLGVASDLQLAFDVFPTSGLESKAVPDVSLGHLFDELLLCEFIRRFRVREALRLSLAWTAERASGRGDGAVLDRERPERARAFTDGHETQRGAHGLVA